MEGFQYLSPAKTKVSIAAHTCTKRDVQSLILGELSQLHKNTL